MNNIKYITLIYVGFYTNHGSKPDQPMVRQPRNLQVPEAIHEQWKRAAPAGQLCSRCSKRLASTRTMVGGIWKLSDGHVSCLYWYIYQTLFHQSSDPEKVYCEPKWQVGVQNHLGVHLLFSVFRSPKKSFAGWLCQAGHSAGGEAGDGQNEMLGWMGQWG